MLVAAGCGGGGGGGKTTSREATWVKENHLPAAAVPGAKLFLQQNCTTCHTYLGTGNLVAGATDLTDEGTKGRGVEYLIAHLKCPSCVVPGSPMPAYPKLSAKQLRQLAVFLEASRGGK